MIVLYLWVFGLFVYIYIYIYIKEKKRKEKEMFINDPILLAQFYLGIFGSVCHNGTGC